MIKAIAKISDNVDISSYYKVTCFLKGKSSRYTPVQAEVFKPSEINEFLMNAQDNEWLDVKVVCIFVIFGGLRTDELIRITTADVETHGDLLLVKIWETKTKKKKSFTICGTFCNIVQKYAALRTPAMANNQFFVNYRAGRCTAQVIGKHKFAKMPERIAKYLKLPNPNTYTGHALRQSSATFLANIGASTERLMRHGGWKSLKVAEGYVAASIRYKEETDKMISSNIASVSSRPVTTSSSRSTTSSSLSPITSSTSTAMTWSVASQGYINNIGSEKPLDTEFDDVMKAVDGGMVASQGYMDYIAGDEDDNTFGNIPNVPNMNTVFKDTTNDADDSANSVQRELQNKFNFSNYTITFNFK